MIYRKKYKIIDNSRISADCHKMRLEAPDIVQAAKPGQFLNVRIAAKPKPLLRRPFAVHNVDREKGILDILYKVRGQGTKLLSTAASGEALDIIGPLGNGYNIDGDFKKAVIAGGGYGVAPLYYLARQLQRLNKELIILTGYSCSEDVLCESEFRAVGGKCQIALEASDNAKSALVTDLLKSNLKEINPADTMVFASGPKAMLKEITGICKTHKLKAQLSLDAIMACGVGVCLGCSISTKNGYKLVCKDGPVFDAEEIIWQ